MLKKLNDFLKNNAFSKQLISWSKKIVLPGSEGMTLYVTLTFFISDLLVNLNMELEVPLYPSNFSWPYFQE